MADEDSPVDGVRQGGRSSALVRKRFDWTETSPSIAIVTTLSSLPDHASDVLALWDGMTLADYIDPDALDAILTHGQGSPSVVDLTLDGTRIRIEGDELAVFETEPSVG